MALSIQFNRSAARKLRCSGAVARALKWSLTGPSAVLAHCARRLLAAGETNLDALGLVGAGAPRLLREWTTPFRCPDANKFDSITLTGSTDSICKGSAGRPHRYG